jgi:hypothetical protein
MIYTLVDWVENAFQNLGRLAFVCPFAATISTASAFHGTEFVVWHSIGPSGTCQKAALGNVFLLPLLLLLLHSLLFFLNDQITPAQHQLLDFLGLVKTNITDQQVPPRQNRHRRAVCSRYEILQYATSIQGPKLNNPLQVLLCRVQQTDYTDPAYAPYLISRERDRSAYSQGLEWSGGTTIDSALRRRWLTGPLRQEQDRGLIFE